MISFLMVVYIQINPSEKVLKWKNVVNRCRETSSVMQYVKGGCKTCE